MNISNLKNKDLLAQFSHIVTQEKEAIAAVVSHLAEIDRRKLYLEEAFASLFEFCVKKYHYSEQAAYLRILAARLSQKYPEIINLLQEGKVHLTALSLVSSRITPQNKNLLLKSVEHRSRRDIEKNLAQMFPSTDITADKIRKLPLKPVKNIVQDRGRAAPASNTSGVTSRDKSTLTYNQALVIPAEAGIHSYSAISMDPRRSLPSTPIGGGDDKGADRYGTDKTALIQEHICPSALFGQSSCANVNRMREAIKPVTANRYKIELSCSEKLTQKIKRAKEVLRHKFPEGKLEDVLDEALEALLEKKDPLRKLKRREVKSPNFVSRHPERSEGSLLSRRDPSPSAQDDGKLQVHDKYRKPGAATRYIPQAIKTAVWKRDGGQCTYVSPDGRRCSERGALELDHIHPYALGGEHSVQNLMILCRCHNQWRAYKTFGFSFPSCKPIPHPRSESSASLMRDGRAGLKSH